MILRLVLSVYLIHFIRAVEWQSFSIMSGNSGTPRPLVISETNAESKPDSHMAFNNPFLVSNGQVPSIHNHMLDITSHNTKCYTLKSVMKMVRGILGYLSENPNKINYLHHLISFLKDEDENTLSASSSNQFGEVVHMIEKVETLPYQDKKLLRDLLDVEERNIDMKTNIVFKHEIPNLNQPECKNVFMKLVTLAHDAYMHLAKYPTCQINEYYDKSNNDQPVNPAGQINIPDNFFDIVEPDKNKPNVPIHNPYDEDYITNIKYFFDAIKEDSNNQKPDDISDYFKGLLIGLTENPNEEKPIENWPLVYPDIKPNPTENNYIPNPFNILETTTMNINDVEINPEPPVKDNGDDKFIDFLFGIKPDSANSLDELMKYLLHHINQNNYNLLQKPDVIEKIISLIKPHQDDVSHSNIVALIELLRNTNAGSTNPKLIEIILPLFIKTKTVPDPKVIQIINPLLKPNVNGVINPRIIELILSLLQLKKEDVTKEKYQIIFSLLRPDENGEVNPKLIEIISYLLKANESSAPNPKILQILVSLLNVGNIHNPKNIDILIHLLKQNKNHSIPEQVYYKIIQFLIKLNVNKAVVPNMNNLNLYYPYIKYPKRLHNVDGKLLALVLAKNPQLLYKLVPNNPYAVMPNQFNHNTPGIIELTYLLKHPKPFVYQPFYYVKYRLPLPTFVTNVKNLLQKDPHLTSNPTKLYQDLITISNVTEISPNLQGYSKEDILKLTFDNGALIKTTITDDKNKNFKEQIKLLQDLNSDVLPENILEQSDHILNDQEFKDKAHKLDQFWNALHPEIPDAPVPTIGNLQITALKKQPTQPNPFFNNLIKLTGSDNNAQPDIMWSDTSLRNSHEENRKDEK